MKAFAELIDALGFQPQRTMKLRLLTDHFRTTPDPDRGLALAAMTGSLRFTHAKPALIRSLVTERVDPQLFALSYDYVGDLAETVSLIWPARPGGSAPPTLAGVAHLLSETPRAGLPGVIAGLLDALDASGRYALIKLVTGALRIGVSARLAKQAVADLGSLEVNAIEELWPSLTPPYTELFLWAEGRGPRPAVRAAAVFRPVMLAHPFDARAQDGLDPAHFLAEWKWDGIRVQAVAEGGARRLYSRTGEDIGAAFPDLLSAMDFDGVVDGELLILRDGQACSFNDLQQRLNRKTVTARLMASHPAHVRAYDLLAWEGVDLRGLPFSGRRARLEAALGGARLTRFDVSPLVPFRGWAELNALRRAPPEPAVEGVMLKHRDSPYLPGRVTGPWWKWKRDPFLIDAVLMYAQRGHGRRSSYYSDYTFGVWRGAELVPVGKAYFGFSDDELKAIDRFVRAHTVQSFGPVREVVHTAEAGLVLEIAFEGLQRSPRHKSGLAMRFPRISRLRWDKPPGEADRIETLAGLLDAIGGREA